MNEQMLGSAEASVNRSRGRAPWIAIVTLAALAAGLAVGVSQWRRSATPPSLPAQRASDAGMPADTGDAIIDKALAQVPVDSTELKNRWLDEIPGLDVSTLSVPQRSLLVRVANSYRCSCGCGFTLATCRAYDTTCPVSGPRVEALRDSVREGLLRETKDLRARPS